MRPSQCSAALAECRDPGERGATLRRATRTVATFGLARQVTRQTVLSLPTRKWVWFRKEYCGTDRLPISFFQCESATMNLRSFAAVFVSFLILASEAATAAVPGYSPPIVARGEVRDAIKSQDIHDRPNRPMHIYGNTVRRRSDRKSIGGFGW